MKNTRFLLQKTAEQARTAADTTSSAADVLANISHEIRTPLNAMRGLLKLLLQTELTAEQSEYLNLTSDTAASLLDMLNDILLHARIQAGEQEIESIPFSLRRCLDDALKLMACEARQKGLELIREIGPEVPDALLGDPLRLRQIVLNLLGNAIKFADHGDIALRVAVQAGNADEISCHFSVSDHGIGIAPAQQAAIFAPYRQVDRSIARRYGGSGLGLSISARLVELMNGTIWLDSIPGQGSCFHFTACFGRQPGTTCTAQSLPENAAPPRIRPNAPLHILLVEDNPTNCRLAQITLEQAGHRVLLANNAAAASAVLQIESPDLILMDVQMPGMDGFQATAAIRCQEAAHGRRPIPIIALTAHVLPGDRTRCLRAGMDDYLCKPVEADALLAAIRRIDQRLPQDAPPARRCSVLDRNALLRQVAGDRHLLAEIQGIFVHDCGSLMADLRRALAGHDAPGFAYLTHTLSGMFRSLSAKAAQEAAGHLETGGIDDARVGVSYSCLEHEIKVLRAALHGMLRHTKPAHRKAPGQTAHPAVVKTTRHRLPSRISRQRARRHFDQQMSLGETI